MPRKKPAAKPAFDPAAASLPALDGAPWYVKLVIWLLVWFGFPVFMCVIFLMLIVGYIPSPLTSLQKDMTDHMREMKRVMEYVDASTRISRQICRNTSTNPAERVQCDL